jgi:hypothetical protein
VANTAQSRAVQNYRRRLTRRGMARFEVLGLKKDRELVRAVARKLAENTQEAKDMRASISQTVVEKRGMKGGILAWLRNSPLVGADLDLTRPFTTGRKIDL